MTQSSLKIIKNQDLSFSGLYDLGLQSLNLGKFEDAIECFKKALEQSSNSFEANFYYGLALTGKGLFKEAEKQFLITKEINPSSPELHYNLGRTYDALGRFYDASNAYRASLNLDATFLEAWINLGIACQELGQYDEAINCYKKALGINQNAKDVWLNLGVTLHDLNRFEEALLSFNNAIKIDPHFALAHWNKALVDLTVGNFQIGWEGYEYRAYGIHNSASKYSGIPRLVNLNIAHKKKILVWHEQGYGDTIHFSRYIKVLNDMGCKVTFIVPNTLKTLLKSLGCCDVVCEIDNNNFDFQIPLLSLPRLLKINSASPKIDIPYLSIDSETSQKWVNKLKIDKKLFNIGIAISGSAAHTKNSKRSIPLEKLELITKLGTIYILQKDIFEDDKIFLNGRQGIIFCGNLIDSYADTAGILSSMDIVISVDTSLAHLSGALGIKTFILLPFCAEWRWQDKGKLTFWYPNTTLCRQTSIGDWDSAVQKAYLKIEDFIANKKFP